jgi:HK97 family phage prohead protease
MKLEHKSFEIKLLQEQNNIASFEGYASTFGNIDSCGDEVMPGAFTKSLSDSQGIIKLLYQHDCCDVIGIARCQEDNLGLKVNGEINLDTQRGREVLSLLKQVALDSMSIGYITKDCQFVDQARKLIELDLKEISIVTFPANEQAVITAIKSKQEIKNIKDFEKFLRESGYSRTEACLIASKGYKALESQSESEGQSKAETNFYTEFFKELNKK